MRFRLGLALVLAMATGCGDDAGDGSSDDGDRDAGAPDGRVETNMDARTPLDAFVPDTAPPPSGPLDAAQLPAMPASLSIRLQTTACLGSCPVYKVTVNQAGDVTFVGGGCSARPGVFNKTIAPADVQGFYEQLRASPYFGLNNNYATLETCPMLRSDGPSRLWDVIVEGVRKPLDYDTGCLGVPALEQVEPLGAQLAAVTQVQSWAGNGEPCEVIRGEAPLGELGTRYRVARDGKPLAMLQFHDDRTFELTDCSGNVLTAGFERSSLYVSFLVDQSERKLKLGDYEFGSLALLRFSENESVVAYGIRENDEVQLGFVEAESCTVN